MSRWGPLLTDAQWNKFEPLLPDCGNIGGVDFRGPTTGAFWRAFCGRCPLAGFARVLSAPIDLLAAVA